MNKNRITSRKYQGDDKYSHAVFIDGRPVVTGLSADQVHYEKEQVSKHYGIPLHKPKAPSAEAQKRAYARADAKRDATYAKRKKAKSGRQDERLAAMPRGTVSADGKSVHFPDVKTRGKAREVVSGLIGEFNAQLLDFGSPRQPRSRGSHGYFDRAPAKKLRKESASEKVFHYSKTVGHITPEGLVVKVSKLNALAKQHLGVPLAAPKASKPRTSSKSSPRKRAQKWSDMKGVQTGPKGGKYRLTKSGNKVYL